MGALSEQRSRAGDAPVLELRGITKRFGPVVANDGVSFDLRAGEVHALLGENGAGKSTLVSVLYGLTRPDEGEMLLDGRPVVVGSPERAIELCIGMVHQHFMLVPVMTVAENIVLAVEPRAGLALDRRAAAARVREISDRYGLAVDPDAVVEDTTVGMQQRVEILRALFRGARVLVLDEPTAVLTAQETRELFAVLDALRADGTAIVFISHKLNEVLEISDRVTVLRRGRKVGTVDTADTDEAGLARMMVGRDVVFGVEKRPAPVGEPILEARDLDVRDDRDLPAVRGVSLAVRSGEIVALAGVDGNGQRELLEAVAGLRHVDSGQVLIDGQDVTNAGVRRTADAGLAHIAEDRQRRGLVLPFTLAENLALRDYRRPGLSRGPFIDVRAMRRRAEELLAEFDVRGGAAGAPATALSGGNQQKVVLARELSGEPRALIAAQPTRGLDVGAIEFVHRRLIEERDKGRGILLVSFEAEEVRALADRIVVIYEGRIVGEFPPDVDEEQLGLAMTGALVR